MTDEQKFNVKRIIYWKNQIAEIKEFLEATNEAKTKNILFSRAYKVKFFGFAFLNAFERDIELSEEMFLKFRSFLKDYQKHLEGLIEKLDAELVSVADVIRDGEITKDGLRL